MHLHIYRCTGDVTNCRKYYEQLTTVDGKFLEWRQDVIRHRPPDEVFVQPNTFIDQDGKVQLREYESTIEGVIQSWAERQV